MELRYKDTVMVEEATDDEPQADEIDESLKKAKALQNRQRMNHTVFHVALILL